MDTYDQKKVYGLLSLDLRVCLKNSISENLPFCKIRVIFKT